MLCIIARCHCFLPGGGKIDPFCEGSTLLVEKMYEVYFAGKVWKERKIEILFDLHAIFDLDDGRSCHFLPQ